MQSETIRELCSQIAAENSSKKLVALIARLRVLLAENKIEWEDKSGRKSKHDANNN